MTFHRDVEPILQKHCQACHRPGEIGPFPLLTYGQARKYSRRIREAVVQKRMPPWHADPKHGTWKNDRSLSKGDIDKIARWVDSGAKEGDPEDAPDPRAFTKGWNIGTPDVVFKIPRRIRVKAEGAMPYKYAFVRTKFEEEKWVQAMEIRAGAREVVHHILVFVQRPGFEGARDLEKFRGGLKGYFGVMVPGEQPVVFPDGYGKRIPAKATMVFQIHYTPIGTEKFDRSMIGIRFAKEKPEHEVITTAASTQSLRIPPGEANHRESASYKFKSDAYIQSLLPHMHLRGKSFRYEATYPDGKKEVLLDVPRYDFNWQNQYRFKDPKFVPKGTRIRAIAHFDNSKDNPANPDPDRWVRFGEQTWEEMLIGYIDYVKAGDR